MPYLTVKTVEPKVRLAIGAPPGRLGLSLNAAGQAGDPMSPRQKRRE
jgi:hypothetical protein